jgi:hypothetical protein
MPEFILYDRIKKDIVVVSGQDPYLDTYPHAAAREPGAFPVPVNEAENRHRFVVYFGTPALTKALAKVKEGEDPGPTLAEHGSEAVRIFMDVPRQG